jgi:carbon storage regulator
MREEHVAVSDQRSAMEGASMLVLSRKPNQSITIGSDIRIVVVGLDRDHVKLGIDAPRGVRVHRSEVAERQIGKDSGEADKSRDARVRRSQATERRHA